MAVSIPGVMRDVLAINRIDQTCPTCNAVFQVSANWATLTDTIDEVTCPKNKCRLSFTDGKFVSVDAEQKAA